MSEPLIHYAPGETVLDPSLEYPQESGWKPNGLWVSVDRAWRDWCEAESFRLDAFVVPHRVTVPASTRVLRLKGPDAIDAFTRRYRSGNRLGHAMIDWSRVAAEHDGILIAPYCWSRRLTPETFWYYGWDCASGCIWNLAGVQMRAMTPNPVRTGAE
jgi:hypothetical protein